MSLAILLVAAGCSERRRPASDAPLGRRDAEAPSDAAVTGRDGAEPAPPPDAGATDAGPGGSSDAAVAPEADAATDAGAVEPALPAALADTGLYAPGSTSMLAPGVLAFAPRYALWSDGADKQRWLLLPEGAQIDTTDMDAWSFPVGTKLWKEFASDGKRLETRLLWKTEQGWYAIAFAWNDAETEALAASRGAQDVRGTEHDVPRRSQCGECHGGRPDFVLGVSAIQLSHTGSGATLQSLAADDKLSAPPSADFALADSAEWNALGYLHANCGSCHNPTSATWDKLDLDLWLRVAELSAASGTQSYLSSVSVAQTETTTTAARVEPGDAAGSGIIARMTARGGDDAMPPLASERVDDAGVELVADWIEGL